MRVAKRYSGKSEMVALESSFHGRTNATLSITGNSARKKGGYTYLSGIAFAPAPYCYRCFAETTPDKCDLLCARRVGEVMRLHLSGNVCAFIAEPVMGEGGIITPPHGYFKRVKQILDDEGALFICDEVQSGFGRTGKMFAIEHYGVEPDIICMAKASPTAGRWAPSRPRRRSPIRSKSAIIFRPSAATPSRAPRRWPTSLSSRRRAWSSSRPPRAPRSRPASKA